MPATEDARVRNRAQVEMSAMSGLARITIRPRQPLVAIILECAGCYWFGSGLLRHWHETSFYRTLEIAVVVWAAGTLLYFLTGHEVLEFDGENLTIRRFILGWEWVSRYPTEKCSELAWCAQERPEDHHGLECKVGWRKIKFARYASEEQSSDIIAFLQRELPDVARKMLSTAHTNREQVTKLNLS